MRTIILKDIVTNTGSNEQGSILFEHLENAFLNQNPFVLFVDSDLSMASSFLNSSIGFFLDKYGLDKFRETVKFQGSKNQYSRLSSYISKYSEIYLVH